MEKCQLGLQKIPFIGDIISNKGIEQEHQKVDRIIEAKRPENYKKLQSFMGTSNYLNKFIESYADVVSPLFTLTSKKGQLLWSEEHESTFIKIKERLGHLPTPSLPRKNDQIILKTDASSKAVGASLSQIVDGQEHILSFANRKLNVPEEKYYANDRELLVIIWDLKKLRVCLLGRHF